jgi:hypothetical protein
MSNEGLLCTMAYVFELHANTQPIFAFEPEQSYASTSTPNKPSSDNALSAKRSNVQDLLWTEMKDGGWVADDSL